MMKALQLAMMLGLAWSVTGCATFKTWDHIVIRADEPLREFKPSGQLYEGRFLGPVEKDIALQVRGETQVHRESFDHFQFAGPLRGKNRYLQIYIRKSRHPYSAGRIEETRVPVEGGKMAFLYTGNFADVVPPEEIKAYFLEEHHVPLAAWNEYPVLLRSGESLDPRRLKKNNQQLHLYWRSRRANICSELSYRGRRYGGRVSLHLNSVKRKRGLRIAAASLLSVATVPLDIVTFPVQWLWGISQAAKHPV
jgi:hypothetical protein